MVPNVQIKIVHMESGQTLGPNEEGELCSTTESFMSGYYNNPQATHETIDEDGS